MDILNRYFGSLVFQYIEEKQGYVIYGAAIHSQLAGDKQRYVFAFVPAHLAIQTKAKLSELPWRNLQTRLCPKTTYRLRPQTWKIPHEIDNVNLKISSRNKNYAVYEAENSQFPFEVLLINNPKKKSIYQHPNTINLHWAIDQFCTIFNYTGHTQPIQLIELPQQPIPLPPPASNPLSGWFGGTQISSGDASYELID